MDALKLRIDTGVRKIEVNDNGDYIMLQVADQSIPPKLRKFSKAIEAKIDKLRELIGSVADVEAIEELTDSEVDIEAVEELAYEIGVFAKASIDDIFGVGTCKKVFGDIVPPLEMYKEFIEDIIPYFQEYALNRAKKLSKYSPNRMGSAE